MAKYKKLESIFIPNQESKNPCGGWKFLMKMLKTQNKEFLVWIE